MRLAIAGSRDLPAGTGTLTLNPILTLAAKDWVTVLMRKGLKTRPGILEGEVALIVNELTRAELPVSAEWRLPVEQGGRQSVFARDVEMVAAADLVLVFLTNDAAEDGYTGTYHIFEQALQQERPVYAWRIDDRFGVPQAKRLGEYDPQHLFAEMLKGA